MLSATTVPLQQGGSLSEFSGLLRSSASLPMRWNATSDEFMSAVSFRNHAASHLLKYDSMLGIFDADVEPVGDNAISVDGKVIKVVSDRNPSNLPWGELSVDLFIEGTGVFVDHEGAGKHIQAGAKKVLITAPYKGNIPTYVVGVNADQYNPDEPIISNASCTTNCRVPFVKVLDQKFGIIKGTMTTTHFYTCDQRLLDASHRDLRRARAAALNIDPTSTSAAKAVALVLPNLKGKLNGIALWVPTPNVSILDLVVQVSRKTLAEEVNQAFRDTTANELQGILEDCDVPLVSVDFRIAGGTIYCDSRHPLPHHSMLEKSLREVLDLSCQSSCDTLDQALDVSNIPKGLSLLTRIVEGTNCCDSIPPRPLGVGEKPKRGFGSAMFVL
ncbi:Glyceraldehyde-3-phosphate dehydrogenase A, chloroplastic [Zea mays]|uniref:glyceraldehyde-3-phosphate dehydrogenase (NADP(+)) (phosphorylating) n=1 Tax=Zea mays TaxID=4577 RepID=A0A3L6G7S7_MAIZE|nr:Glyceraldehyde-3-phosphate dehydrogenase A, chloroplastic [Zea mays]